MSPGGGFDKRAVLKTVPSVSARGLATFTVLADLALKYSVLSCISRTSISTERRGFLQVIR